MEGEFRSLPSVDRVLSDERLRQLEQTYAHSLLLSLVRRHLEHSRLSIAAGNPCPSVDEIVEAVSAQVRNLERPGLGPLINATGVILHTNLGRAPLSKETMAAMDAVAKGYCNLEFELDTGTRGSRTPYRRSRRVPWYPSFRP